MALPFRTLQKLIQRWDELESDPRRSAANLYALGLEHMIYHRMIQRFREQIFPEFGVELQSHLAESLGEKSVSAFLDQFDQIAPRGQSTASTAGDSSAPPPPIIAEELLVSWLANQNPACQPYLPLFDDQGMQKDEMYGSLIEAIDEWLKALPVFGKEKLPLLDLLRAPMRVAPDSLPGQLTYIRDHWGAIIGEELPDLLRGLDLLEEERRDHGVGGPGPIQAPLLGDRDDREHYSEDAEWMPSVVMLAKNTLVWLDQLSRQYDRPIQRLDEIPTEELDSLATRGFTALWLIGLWERSDISRTIKHWCGNPDAESSAYSLKEYQIMAQIGGEDALQVLGSRCRERGIRLASDMVPNHTGLDSPWVKEHPDWYMQTTESPFPSYRFNSGNLSSDPDLSIQIEDHYFSREDAAVVFKHTDQRDGRIRYIYHGNDGTTMPWNDTAQLDYLNPEVREAIIGIILEVARRFPIIRFDAAMTLAKQHIQRLWYPAPGSGGDIPSRSRYGIPQVEFDQNMPEEFWREVVDRVAEAVPDTLLLAEAFWMMEGYFVRSLGMHRVYNSAFMNMLKMEENGKFRGMIKATLAYDPRILQRYVNFLSNPDEETAVAQFGRGDKYFAVTTLLVTLPGLPMFAHGQIEGFEEKYGMEFRRAYWNEEPDPGFIERHEREIFPLARKRRLFSGAENFRLFDFWTEAGVNENVLAYANRLGNECSLVLVNNSYEATSGVIRHALPFHPAGGEELHDTLLSALGIQDREGILLLVEQRSGLKYLRTLTDLSNRGFDIHLQGYEARVFWQMEKLADPDGRYARLLEFLGGKGVADLEAALEEMSRAPLEQSFRKIFLPATLRSLVGAKGEPDPDPILHSITGFSRDCDAYLGQDMVMPIWEVELSAARQCMLEILATDPLEIIAQHEELFRGEQLETRVNVESYRFVLLLGLLVRHLGRLLRKAGSAPRLEVESLPLAAAIGGVAESLQVQGLPRHPDVLPVALERVHWVGLDAFEEIFEYPCVRYFLEINAHAGTDWYSQEQMESFLFWMGLRFRDQAEIPMVLGAAWRAHAACGCRLAEFIENFIDQTD